MKPTLLHPAARASLVARIAQLQPHSPALWGKMNAAQVLCHLADQLRMALGELSVNGKAGFWGRTLMKTLVLAGLPAPKGKVPTLPELDQMTAGTPPTDFEHDRQALYHLIDNVVAQGAAYPWAHHPSFGRLDHRQWCRLAWIHLDHHLRQFGV